MGHPAEEQTRANVPHGNSAPSPGEIVRGRDHSHHPHGHEHSPCVGHGHGHEHSPTLGHASTFRESLHALSQNLADGSRQINQYHILRPIGQGAYGMVHLGELRDEANHFVAIKEFGKMRLRRNLRVAQHRRPREPNKNPEVKKEDDDPLYLVRTEVAIMKKLHHPNVIRLFEVLDDSDKEELYMVYEYCSGGVVYNVKPGEQTTPLSEEMARKYFVQILSGIDYLHVNGIVHRDIKPDNILLTQGGETCKMVDFGVSEMFVKPGDDTMPRTAGSPAFMSPALCEAGHGETHGCPDDIWAFGVTLYCMVVGRLPFYKENLYDLYESVRHDDLQLDDHLSPECCDLLKRMLDKNENTRITVPEMYKHPWVSKKDAEPIPILEEIEKNMVEEITEEDVQCAICRISSVFAVARAVSRFKRHSTMRRDSETPSDSSGGSAQPRAGSLMLPRRLGSVPLQKERMHSLDTKINTSSNSILLDNKGSLQDSPTLMASDASSPKLTSNFPNLSRSGRQDSLRSQPISISPTSTMAISDEPMAMSPTTTTPADEQQAEADDNADVMVCSSPTEQDFTVCASPSST